RVRPVGVQRHEEAVAMLVVSPQPVDAVVELQAAEQGALAATRVTQQHQRRAVLQVSKNLAEVVKARALGRLLEALALGSLALVDQQGQRHEAVVDLIARLRPLRDAAEPVLGEAGRRVLENVLNGLRAEGGIGSLALYCLEQLVKRFGDRA